MPNFIIALIIIFGGLWLIRKFARVKPAQIPGLTKKLTGGAIIIVSGFLALRGMSAVAIPLFALGMGMIGQSSLFPNGFGWTSKTPGQTSRVATSVLAMEMEHDTGQITGQVLSGPLKGTRLEDLNNEQLATLYKFCGTVGDQSLSLLEAWLDRNKPEWRDIWQSSGKQQNGSRSSVMSAEEAYAVLGLKATASQQDIKNAHRRLMKEFHPDRGGSDYLAAKINQAKDLLIQD